MLATGLSPRAISHDLARKSPLQTSSISWPSEAFLNVATILLVNAIFFLTSKSCSLPSGPVAKKVLRMAMSLVSRLKRRFPLTSLKFYGTNEERSARFASAEPRPPRA